MGQQQLLLLVLSTVIVGLATVAGIQAFSENQTKATQDALTQRAITIGNDILAAHNSPDQLGGQSIDGTSDKKAIMRAAGFGEYTGSSIPADGAGSNAGCTITDNGSTVTVTCADNGSGGSASDDDASTNQSVTVTVDPSLENPVQLSTINTNSA